MASSNFSVSLAGLQGLGSELAGIAAVVSSGAVFPPANGAEAYRDVADALGQFTYDWDNAVSRLQDQTVRLGEKVSGIGRLMAYHDASLAASFDVEGWPMPRR